MPVHLAAKLAQRVSGETLSEREIDVLKLMAQGKSNKEIGSALFISEGTVKSHVKSIFAKMNVISRTEAVANATRRLDCHVPPGLERPVYRHSVANATHSRFHDQPD